MNEIDAIRARHAAVEARREWAYTVAPEDAAAAHADRGALLDHGGRLEAETSKLRVLAEKVNGIRNSIIGMQGFNFSEHAYPLVAALKEAGIEGADYPEARQNLGTLIEQRDKAERDRDEALAKLAHYEAPGPAVLKADHYPDCSRDAFTECDCSARPIEQAYREQHARDVAIVEAMNDVALGCAWYDVVGSDAVKGRAIKAAVLRALKGETADCVPAQPADEQDMSAAAADRLLAVEEETDRQASLRAHEETADDWVYVRDSEFEE